MDTVSRWWDRGRAGRAHAGSARWSPTRPPATPARHRASEEEASARPPQQPESSGSGAAIGATRVPGRPRESRGRYRATVPRAYRVSPTRSRPVEAVAVRQTRAAPPARELAGGPARAILIERSMGVQIGRDNDQVSVYLVRLPKGSFVSAQRLAETLLSPQVPWSRDVFRHDGRANLPDTRGLGPGASSSAVFEGPGGDTLVIVRNSRGVQVGDRNTQRNEFPVRVRAVAISADTVGGTRDRLEWISRLRANPGDREAARLLAEDVGQAARERLQADFTVRVLELVGEPRIRRWTGRFRDLVGRQIGHANRARVQIEVGEERSTPGRCNAASRLSPDGASPRARNRPPHQPPRGTQSARCAGPGTWTAAQRAGREIRARPRRLVTTVCSCLTTSLRLPGGPARWPSQNQAVSLAAAEASCPDRPAEFFDNPARPSRPSTSRSRSSRKPSVSGERARCGGLTF